MNKAIYFLAVVSILMTGCIGDDIIFDTIEEAIADLGTGHDQLGIDILGALGEFVEQRRLATAGFASYKRNPALAGPGKVQKAVQLHEHLNGVARFTEHGDDHPRLGVFKQPAWQGFNT